MAEELRSGRSRRSFVVAPRFQRFEQGVAVVRPQFEQGTEYCLLKMVTPRRFNDAQYAAAVVGDLYGGSARTDPDRVLRLMGDDLRPASTRGYIHQLTAGVGWVSLPWLGLVRQQTLILAGDDDPIIPLVNARIMHRLLPHACLNIYQGGHVALVTEADRRRRWWWHS